MNTAITIRPLDVSSDTELEQLIGLERAVGDPLYGGTIATTVATRRVRLQPTAYSRGRDWVAVTETMEGGQMIVGHASVLLPLQENLSQAYVNLSVHPAHRGQGIGTALLEQAALPAVREEGRPSTTLWGEVPADGDPHDPAQPWNRIAAHLGLSSKNIAIARACDLPVPPATLEQAETEAARKLGGYRVELWEDTIPEEHLEAYGVLLHQLDLDDPDGDLDHEAAEYTPERIRALEKRRRESGTRVLTAVAIAPDGTVAGNSEIHWNATAGTTRGWQENTLVMPAHRGHRLGLAMKAATHRRISEIAPDLQVLITWNSATNPWMIAVNETLGYRVAFRQHAYQGPTPGD